MEASGQQRKRKARGGGGGAAAQDPTAPIYAPQAPQGQKRRYVHAKRRDAGATAGRDKGGGRGRRGPGASGAKAPPSEKEKSSYFDFYRSLSPSVKRVAGRVLNTMSKPRRLSTRLDKEDKKQLKKRVKSEERLSVADNDDDGGDGGKAKSASKKQKKAKMEEADEQKQRRRNKKRKLSAEDKDGDTGACLVSIIDEEQLAPDNKEKHKDGKKEPRNKKRKLNPVDAAENEGEEEEEAVEAIDNKDWLSSITLYMNPTQSQLISPIKVVFAFTLQLYMMSGMTYLCCTAFDQVVRREVAWPTEHPVLPRSQAQVRSVLMKHSRGHWAPIPESPSLMRVVEGLAKTGIMTEAQMHSYTFWLKTEQAMTTHYRIQNQASRMAQLYDKGTSILELSATHDFPPVSLFRAILSTRGFKNKKLLKSAMTEKGNPGLTDRDREELAKARAADMITTDQRPEQQTNADLFETEIESYLKSHHIRYKRQDELAQEQRHFFSNVFSTPDFLLVDEVFINGHQVRWIDAKNYYGSSDVDMQKKSMTKQAQRYIDNWGPGAIVFALSYCSDLQLPSSVLKLDASSFPTSRQLDAYSK